MSWYDTALAAWYRSKIESANAAAQGIESAGKSIAGDLQQYRQDKLANDVSSSIMNSGAYAPRAGLVSPGTDPITGAVNTIQPGVSTAGTAPQRATGGLLGAELRSRLGNQGIENALRQAQITHLQQTGAAAQQNAQTNEAARVDVARERIAAQQQTATQRQAQVAQRQAQMDAEKNADTLPRVVSDFDKIHGQGSAQQFFDAWRNGTGYQGRVQAGHWIGDAQGPLFTPSDAAAGSNPDEKSVMPRITMGELQGYLDRVDRINQAGGRYVPPVAQSVGNAGNQQPASAPGGGAGTPPFIRSPQDYQALPSGTAYRDPTGILRQKP